MPFSFRNISTKKITVFPGIYIFIRNTIQSFQAFFLLLWLNFLCTTEAPCSNSVMEILITVYVLDSIHYGLRCDKPMFYNRQYAFSPESGGRPTATKVMVVVTDGESHDGSNLKTVIGKCNEDNITRFGIAVSNTEIIHYCILKRLFCCVCMKVHVLYVNGI